MLRNEPDLAVIEKVREPTQCYLDRDHEKWRNEPTREGPKRTGRAAGATGRAAGTGPSALSAALGAEITTEDAPPGSPERRVFIRGCGDSDVGTVSSA
jgi:hypothetical protein